MRVALALDLQTTAFVRQHYAFVIGSEPRELCHILDCTIHPMGDHFKLDAFTDLARDDFFRENFQPIKRARLNHIQLRALLNPF